MATTFVNLGFESAGATPGQASGWSVSLLSSAEEIAPYEDAGLVPKAVEDFESVWLDNEGFVFELGAVEPAVYDSVAPGQQFEDFEEEWLSNELWSPALGAVDDAEYDTALDPFEDFEEEWLSNELWTDTLGAVDDASYDTTTPQDFEDFEEEWASNENYHFAHGTRVGQLTIIAASQIINRIDVGWITDEFDGVTEVEIFNTLSNDGFHAIDPALTTELNMTSTGFTLANEAPTPASTIIETVGTATYDGGTLRGEEFGGVWTLMVTF